MTSSWPPLFDGFYLMLTGTLAVAMLILSAMTTEDQARSLLGRAIDRYRAIPDDELGPALENAGRSRFYSIAGVASVLVCAMAWRLMLYYGVVLTRFAKAQGWPSWSPYLLAVIPAFAMPFLMQWTSRRLIRRRLDRRFADRTAA